MPHTIYRRGEVWHYRGTAAGRRLRGSTGTTHKATAERIAAEREATEWKRHLDGPGAVLTFAQAAVLYQAAGKTINKRILKLADYWKNTLVKDMNEGKIQQCAIVLYPRAKGSTRNREVIIPTQAIINHAAKSGFGSKISISRFPVIKEEKTPATWAWVQRFMQHAPPHLAGLACFMLLTGARVSEALAVRWDDIDFDRQRVKIRQTKIGNERWAHMPAPLLVAIANCPRDRDTVFRYVGTTSAHKSWQAAVKRAKLPHLSFHACRHGFATAMLHAGVDPVTVAKRGGWKSVQHVFATYGHATDDETVTDRIIDTPVTRSKPKTA